MIKSSLIAALLCCGITYSSSAALMDLGDTTVDTVAELEWLDLTLTQSRSYNEVVSGDFGGYYSAGYRHATTSQICSLFASLGDTFLDCGSVVDFLGLISHPTATDFVSKLGDTFTTISGVVTSCGWYDSGPTNPGLGIGHIAAAPFPDNGGCVTSESDSVSYRADLNISFDEINPLVGNWLVRSAPTVPEPATLAIFTLGLLGLGVARRRKAA